MTGNLLQSSPFSRSLCEPGCEEVGGIEEVG